MIRMSAKEREQRKIFLRGLEGLVEMGGFIKEQILDEIYLLYPSIVSSKMEEHGFSLGPQFWTVADAIENAIVDLGRYSDFLINEDGDFFEIQNEEFEEWAIDQIARLEIQKSQSGEERFWQSWKWTPKTKKVLNSLNVLDERILYLISGLDGEKMDAIQISQMPEFDCDVEFIELIIDLLEHRMNFYEWSKPEFDTFCQQKMMEATSPHLSC